MIKPYEHLYTVKEAAKVLKTNADYIYKLIETKKLLGLKLGSIKIRGCDLEQFVNGHQAINPEEKGEGV